MGISLQQYSHWRVFNLYEMEYHINAKELLAAQFSVKTLEKVPDAHVKLLSDNSTTVHQQYAI